MKDIAKLVGGDTIARAFINGTIPPGYINGSALAGLDLNRLRENDRKYARELRQLIPMGSQSRKGTEAERGHP